MIKFIKIFLLPVFIIGSLLFIVAAPVEAAFDPLSGVKTFCQANPGNSSQPSTQPAACSSSSSGNPIAGTGGVINKVVNILSIVTGVAAVIMIIIGGLEYTLSTGDSSRINSAKNMIIYAVVGLVVVAAAQLIVKFVLSRIK